MAAILDAVYGIAESECEGHPYEVEVLVIPDLLYRGPIAKVSGQYAITCIDGNRRFFNQDHVISARVIHEGQS